MASIYILVSSVLAAAIAAPTRPLGRIRNFLRRKAQPATAAPVVTREEGWSLIRSDDPSTFNEWVRRDEEGFPFMEDEEPSLGSHLLVEMFGCHGSLLEAERTVGKAMVDAAKISEATIVETSFHEFKPYGVSGAVIIQESHYTIHTWPEHGYAAIDLFYCGGTIKVHKALELLEEAFQPTRTKFMVVRRGLQSEVDRR